MQLLQVWQAGALLHHQHSSAAAAVASAATSAAAASSLPAEPLSFSGLPPVCNVNGPVRACQERTYAALQIRQTNLGNDLLVPGRHNKIAKAPLINWVGKQLDVQLFQQT